jgi:hypothetical protein
MEVVAVVCEDVGGKTRPDARRSARTAMIKAAQIAFGAAVIECALLNASHAGVGVFLKAPADVPDLATLRLPGGESRPVRRRWQNGLLAGFEFVGAAPQPLSAG